MITAGVDCGARYVKVVVLDDGRVLAARRVLAGFDVSASANQALDSALEDAGVTRDRIEKIVATGAGRELVGLTDDIVAEVDAVARGVIHLVPEARTVIDVGNEEGRAIRIDADGKVIDFAINEKCAAGAGAFTESMSRALEVSVEELGPLSLESTHSIPMNVQCTVFAESEVVSLIHQQVSRPDIARAVLDGIAERITSMVRRVGLEQRVVLVGGVARNVGFVRGLEEDLETGVVIPDDPDFVGALGAALLAAER